MNDAHHPATEMKRAVELNCRISGSGAEQRHYKLSVPLKDYDGGEHHYVVVSAVMAPYSGPETYIFPANSAGEIVNFGELEGSYKGALDHQVALAGAGYTIAETLL